MLHIHKDLKDNLDLHVWEITKGFTFFYQFLCVYINAYMYQQYQNVWVSV